MQSLYISASIDRLVIGYSPFIILAYIIIASLVLRRKFKTTKDITEDQKNQLIFKAMLPMVAIVLLTMLWFYLFAK